MLGSRGAALAAAGLWLLAVVGPATGQDQPTTPRQPTPAPTEPPVTPTPEEELPPPAPREPAPITTPEEPVPTPRLGAPPTFLGPDLFNPPEPRGRFTLTPSISIVGEYNDNLFQTAGDETEDFIVGIVPGFTLAVQGRQGRLLAGYNFTAEFYAEETDQNDVAKRQQLFADASYRVGPTLTFTLLERLIHDRESSVVSSGSISAGRDESLRNTLAPRFDWQATPRTSLNFSGSHTLLRFEGDVGRDSDTYRVGVGAEHSFTPRLSGTADLDVGYFDIEDEESAVTYTPSLGFSYEFTQTMRGSLKAGPSVFVRDGETELTPAAGVTLERLFRTGSFLVGYNRAVTAESVGSSDRQTVYASLRFPRLTRNFGFDITPRYTRADRDIADDEVGDDREIEVITVNLRATYQIARNISLFGSYIFFQQRVDGGTGDVDQNRVFVGLQYAYPINFD